MRIGIEAMNAYCGATSLDIRLLFEARGLSLDRFDNLMMENKAVGLPCEDPVTNGVNAAKPIIDGLGEKEVGKIELLIASTESGLDFGKAISTYIHDLLGLGRSCRVFEVKQACYAGTAALQMAVGHIASGASLGSKALVIATDCARAASRHSYAEPSQGTGAVAMLISEDPQILELDFGASGYCSYEVMDTCRPLADQELGDPDLSLLSYLDCLENSYQDYLAKVEDVDFLRTFDYLVFHTPFAGIVKGAHRKMSRRFAKTGLNDVEADFQNRMAPSLSYCAQVGNLYSASLYLALCGLVDKAELNDFNRVGLFSYGSGCSSEFFSGVLTSQSKRVLNQMNIEQKIADRYALDMDVYDLLVDMNDEWLFGIKDKKVDLSRFSELYEHAFDGRNRLVLHQVNNYHREYQWS